MSSTNAGPWALFADMIRQGVDTFASTQKTFQDVAAHQNAVLLNAVEESLGRSVTPEMVDLAGRTTQTFLQSQTMMLDLALQQTKLALSLIKGTAGDQLAREFMDMLEEGAMTFAVAQKWLLEFASQQAEAMLKAGREGSSATPNPLSQMAGLSRQAVQAFVDTQKKSLDVIAKETVSATEHAKQQFEALYSGVPAQEFAGMARKSFENYMGLQRQLTEQAARLMDDWTRAWQSGAAWHPSVTFQDLARQGVEAFVNTQRDILEFAFRSSGGKRSS